MTCFECDAPCDHMHHVVPRSLGGTRTVPLCERCHGLVHDRLMNTRALTKAALAVKKSRGERLGGDVPYGWQLAADGVTLEHNEGEQAVVETVRTLRAEGLSLRAIAAELEARGLMARNGGSWHAKQVSRIVRNRHTGRLS